MTLSSRLADAVGQILEADVAVVGTGPAGLALALGLLGTGLRLVLLEAGEDRPEAPGPPSTSPLGRVRVEGEDPYPQSSIDDTRGTGLGGTATRWSFRMAGDRDPGEAGAGDVAGNGAGDGDRGCRYGPLDPVDLAARDDVPHSGWPLARRDLDPWYSRAQVPAGLGAFAYSADSWAGDDSRPLDMAHGTVTSSMFQFGPASAWTRDAVARLRADAKVRIVTGAVVTRLGTDDSGAVVDTVRYVAGGQPGEVRARAVVLAAGGIENSRLLLLSGSERAPRGLGNAHDQVGRYFMEHPLVRGGMLLVDPVGGLPGRLRLYDPHWNAGSLVMAKLTLTDETVRNRGLISTSVLLLPRDASLAAPGVRAFQDLRSPSAAAAGPGHRARLALRAGVSAPDLLRARRAIAEQPGVDDGGWTRRPGAAGVRVLEMLHQTEQTPDPANRVTLDDTLDEHGRRTAVLHWHWTADDRRRVTRARDLYAQAFAKAGYASLVAGDWDGGQPRMIGGNHHHMGGTRMSREPRDGVVDADCRVHGLRNLFVAGSSVFPSGGSVNPTLTIVALALRLAGHLKGGGLAGLDAPAAASA